MTKSKIIEIPENFSFLQHIKTATGTVTEISENFHKLGIFAKKHLLLPSLWKI